MYDDFVVGLAASHPSFDGMHSLEESHHAREYDPVAPRFPRAARASVQSIFGRRRDGQMAATEWLHRQGPSSGRESRRHIQNVVHEFHHGRESLIWRKIFGTRAR